MTATDTYPAELSKFKELSSAFFDPAFVLSAIELGVFTALAQGPCTAAELAARLHADERAIRVLSNKLASLKYLIREDDVLRNSPFAERALVGGSPDYEGDNAMMSLWFLRLVGDLAQVAHEGKPRETYEDVSQTQPDLAAKLVRAMDQNARSFIPQLLKHVSMDGVERILDVGGSSGTLAMALIENNPKARATVFDLPNATAEAEKIIKARGLSDRVSVVPGNFRTDPLGTDYDIVFFSNIMHLLPAHDCEMLVRKSVEALRPGGRLVIKGMVGNAAGENPGLATYAVLMLLVSDGGVLHSQQAHEAWCAAAGLSPPERIDCWERSTLFIARKPAH